MGGFGAHRERLAWGIGNTFFAPRLIIWKGLHDNYGTLYREGRKDVVRGCGGLRARGFARCLRTGLCKRVEVFGERFFGLRCRFVGKRIFKCRFRRLRFGAA